MANEQELQKGQESAPTSSSSEGEQRSADRPVAPGVSRAYVKEAGYEAGADALSPGSDPATKYEKSLKPGAGTNEPTHGGAKRKYEVEGKGAYGAEEGKRFPREFGNVQGSGKGRGNRKGDTEQWVDENDHSKGKEVANEKVSMDDISGIPAPDLSDLDSIAKGEKKGAAGSYAGYNVQAGTKTGTKGNFDLKIGDDGKLEMPSGEAYAVGGARVSAELGMKGEAEGKYGKVEGGFKEEASAYIGGDARAKIGGDGASATANVGLGAEVKVSADADYHTPGVKIEGVEKDLDVGVGVHGEASAWAKAGAGGGLHLTKDKIGATGSIGAGAAVEAKADIHGNIGPVGGTLEGSVMAGAAIGAEGGILYEDGKITIGGRAYAALGYGGKIGGSVTIDLKQSYQVGAAILKEAHAQGIKGAKMAFAAADADQDGKLSLQDAATHGSNAMESGAEGIESGLAGLQNVMDGDGDGKFDIKKDGGAYLQAGADAVSDTAKRAKEGGEAMLKRAGERGSEMVDAAHKAADLDGDNQLGIGDLKAGVEKAGERAGQALDNAEKSLKDAAKQAQQYGSDRIDDAYEMGQKAHKAADRSGDGELGLDDIAIGAGELKDAAVQRGTDAIVAGGQMVDDGLKRGEELAQAGMKRGEELLKEGAKRGGEMYNAGVKRGGEMIDAGIKRGTEMKDAAHKALDRSGDGELGFDDALAAGAEAKKAMDETAVAARKKIGETYDATVKKIEDTGAALHKAADVDGDNKIGASDAIAFAQKKAADAERLRQRAVARARQLKKEADAALAAAAKRAEQAAASAKQALDRSGDGQLGLDDVAAGGRQALAAAQAKGQEVRARATSAYNSAATSLSNAGNTLSAGYDRASGRASQALSDFGSFLGL